MRTVGVWIGLVLSLVGCAGQSGVPPVVTPADGQRPAWKQQMEQARHLASNGKNYAMVVTPLQEEARGQRVDFRLKSGRGLPIYVSRSGLMALI